MGGSHEFLKQVKVTQKKEGENMKIRKSFVAVLAALVSMLGMAETATVDGLLWQYSVSDNKATIEKLLTPGVENVVIPGEIGGTKVVTIGDNAFYEYESIRFVIVPEGVAVIGVNAFSGCWKLQDVQLPSTLKRIENYGFYGCPLRYVRLPKGLEFIGSCGINGASVLTVEGASVKAGGKDAFGGIDTRISVEFLDDVPEGLVNIDLFSANAISVISYPRKHAEEWSAVIHPEQFGGYVPENRCEVSVVSKMREGAPTIMDVRVTPVSAKSEIKIRPVAFLNGISSFANVVKVRTFSDGSESVVKNPIAANKETVFSWNVAADLTNKVAKLKMDVMCVEDEIIPFELISIPASSGHAAMTISRNVISPMRIRDALMWLLADPEKDIRMRVRSTAADKCYWSIEKGGIRIDGSEAHCAAKEVCDGRADMEIASDSDVSDFVIGELGYTILSGDDLEYARKMTGLKLEERFRNMRKNYYVKMK